MKTPVKLTGSSNSGVKPAPACTLVIFGAAGDLTKRLLMPALYNLAGSGLLDGKTRVLGVDHVDQDGKKWAEDLTVAMKSFTHDQSAEFHASQIDPKAWKSVTERLDYMSGDFLAGETYEKLGKAIGDNAIFYFAVAARFFEPIAENLGKAGLLDQSSGRYRRIIIEKPFGHDARSAQELNGKLLAVADEDQLFRIDHFLGKETVQGIMALRFTNGIFEPVWRREFVDHVQITVAETIGVEERGGFYDTTGALRDMVPNHLFQLLCMVAMEPPNSFSAEAVRNSKQLLLEAVNPVRASDAVRGQYKGAHGQPGYRHAHDVDAKSSTETYAALKLTIGNWRWKDVPFYVRTGKCMTTRLSEIAIVFKPAPFNAVEGGHPAEATPNIMRFQVSPQQGTTLSFNAKIPGPRMQVGKVATTFREQDFFPDEPNVGYETLIYDCMSGDATLFQRADNIEASWNVVDAVLHAWKEGEPDLYSIGTDGPGSSDELLERDGRHWLPLDGDRS